MQINEVRNSNISIDEVFKNKNMTFEDIEKLNYKHFNKNSGNKAD